MQLRNSNRLQALSIIQKSIISPLRQSQTTCGSNHFITINESWEESWSCFSRCLDQTQDCSFQVHLKPFTPGEKSFVTFNLFFWSIYDTWTTHSVFVCSLKFWGFELGNQFLFGKQMKCNSFVSICLVTDDPCAVLNWAGFCLIFMVWVSHLNDWNFANHQQTETNAG